MKKLLICTVIAGVVMFSGICTAGEGKAETPRNERMKWWRNARFGMFIHWGVYSVPAGTYKNERIEGIGEWIMHHAEIPVKEYRRFAKAFNPTEYDPERWVKLAKNAGMKYIVITAKHHDGFALFPSAVTEWDIADASPYGKDLLSPLVDAARKHGLKIGFYYSQAQDWVHPGGAKMRYEEGEGWDDEHKGSFDKYLKSIAAPQVCEILTRYNPDILWWDTPVWMNRDRADMLKPLAELCPEIITNNRLGGGYEGDFRTPEQHIPDTGTDEYDWETCMTMNDTWGYKSYDDNWKSSETLIRNLVETASKGGNYLLNVGPKRDGTIPQASVERLEKVGDWMQINGTAVYGTTASPIAAPDWGRITQKTADGDTILYLHIFDWRDTVQIGIENDVKSCYLLAEPDHNLKAETGENGVTVRLDCDAPDSVCSVVVLELEGSCQPVRQ